MHKILQRQIERYLGQPDDLPDTYQKFIEAVDRTYVGFEKEYTLLNRALDISSRELKELNTTIRLKAEDAQAHAEEVERFNQFMVDREVKMTELKRKIRTLEQTKNAVSKELVEESM